MISFTNDYSECAHPLILKNLAEHCYEQNEGYSEDRHCKNASDLIRSYLGNIDVEIHFLNGGTQANLTILSAMLRPFDAVIGTERAHINTHETGAIEGCGHKVLAMPGEDGKLTPEDIEEAVAQNTTVHMVHPAAVYISDTTEIGSVYTKAELTRIREVCNEHGLLLFLDGARLGSALTSAANDLTLRDLAWLTDVFTIGGTKNGALAGEAVVISNSLLQRDFRYYMKHKGAMNAKGFVLGMQFETLFRDRLYFQLAEHANQMAELIKDACVAAGFPFLTRPVSNQIFPVVDNDTIARLQKDFTFEIWEPADDSHQIIRFVTSWATREEQVQELVKAIRKK
ncbi:MAG: aminotransferase class I/II-fold pyridoxal phosphate-dependent enzyme [Lachnospiraceae bacterium]|nr:aminotransferase class I/II-fold pyridoxal phosphate-dependent enzyme [Lachnospiraceae bacterium]